MHEAIQETRTIIIRDVDLDVTSEMNCSQAREHLDELFSRQRLLEETRPRVKRLLFEHLETCRSCCRAFDVRVRFRPAQHRNIY
jgi:hypothetical protein